MKKVFISRDLEEDGSPIRELLADLNVEMFGKSLVEFTCRPFKNVPECDWIFFYSKQGIRNYFNGLDDIGTWKGVRMRMPLPKQIRKIRYATFGKSSAAFLEGYRQIKADFKGTGHAKETAELFLQKAKGKKVLFVRGKNSLKSVQQLLRKEDLTMRSFVAYDNEPMTKFTIPQCHYLLFTSPLNAKAYYQKYKVKQWQRVYAIGDTTARALFRLKVKNVKKPSSPSVAAMIDLVRNDILKAKK
ncbi:MAG: uroporphyrinogen-III synthase [Saprospiraceae bacterium]